MIDKSAVDKTDTAKNDDEYAVELEKNESISDAKIIVTEYGGKFVLVDFEVDNEMKKEEA